MSILALDLFFDCSRGVLEYAKSHCFAVYIGQGAEEIRKKEVKNSILPTHFDDCPTEGFSCTQHSFLSSLLNKCSLIHALQLKSEGIRFFVYYDREFVRQTMKQMNKLESGN